MAHDTLKQTRKRRQMGDGMLEAIELILGKVESTGGGWPVIVLLIVIGAIVYLARYMISRQIKVNEERIAERKQEFDAQLERERNNARSYQDTTDRMVDAFNGNARVISDFTTTLHAVAETLRPMGQTLERIDRNTERTQSLRTRKPRVTDE